MRRQFFFFFCLLLPLSLSFAGGQSEANKPAAGKPAANRDFIGEAFSNMDRAFNDSELTLEDTYYLGRAVAANILGVYRPYTLNPELTRYVNQICQTLVINSPRPAVSFIGFYVTILDSPEFNAFASPGGHIFLTKGLVEAASSEDMLAAVIAHELAHVILRHGQSMISDMSFINETASIQNKAADFAGNSPAAQKLTEFRNAVSEIIDAMVLSGYSQAQEFEADREALKILAASGYDPGSLTEMLQILQQVQGSRQGGFNTTHPSPAQRIANIQGQEEAVEDSRSFRAPRFRNR
ncbi:MAG: M48 family metalloprotease [Treponema sp.]|nr:M48 family metalloprotease [Treponema sp.]